MTLKMQVFANVWDALEPDPIIRANLKLRSALMLEITKWFDDSGYTQREAATILGTTQPRLNDVLKGKIDRCTIDRLVNMLEAAGQHVSFSLARAA
jgi:predicted XRE-type DNA-binding protein